MNVVEDVVIELILHLKMIQLLVILCCEKCFDISTFNNFILYRDFGLVIINSH